MWLLYKKMGVGTKYKKMDLLYEKFNLSHLIYLFLMFFSVGGKAVSGSITDMALSGSRASEDRSFYGSITTEMSRNTRVSADQFLHPHRKDGLFDQLYFKNDLIFNFSLASYFSSLENSEFFKNVNLFFILPYQRPVYASTQEINTICWGSVLCFEDINIGVSKPFFKTDRFSFKSSIYLRVPFSRASFQKSLLMGLGVSTDTSYKLLSVSHFDLSFVFRSYLDFDYYLYQTANAHKTIYNVPLNIIGQLGFKIHYSKYSFVPALFVYGSYGFSLDYKVSTFHKVRINISTSWSVSKKMNIIAGLSWGDRILKPRYSPLAIDTLVFDPDRTFINIGANYSF